jgi:hypothetical protein
MLENTFQRTHYPEVQVVDKLSETMNLSIERISIWFQNRRARFKRSRKLDNRESRLDEFSEPMLPTQATSSSVPYKFETNSTLATAMNENSSLSSDKENDHTPMYSFNNYKPVELNSPPSSNQVPANSTSFFQNLTSSYPAPLPFYQSYAQ